MLFCPYEPFWGSKNLKNAIFEVFYDSDAPISTHMNDKWMPNSKSAHQITPGDTKIRKMTYDVIKCH